MGTTLDAIWQALHLEHKKLFPIERPENVEQADSNSNSEIHSEPANLIDAAINAEPVIFGQSPDALRTGRRRSRRPTPQQASLFGSN